MWLWVSVGGLTLAAFLLLSTILGLALEPARERTRRIEEVVGVQKEETLFVELETPISERLLQPISERITILARGLLPQEKEIKYRKRIELAGNPGGIKVQTLVGLKFILSLALGLAGLVFSPLLAICLAILGVLAPEFWLSAKQKERQQEVVRSLPDMLDLLCISVSAGLGFDAALSRVAEKFTGPLSTEFKRTLQEVRMGKPRREALREMADRLQVDEVSTFVGAIIQADTLGVSITRVLEVQSAQQRVNRRQKAEEAAQKAPIKLLIPLVVFIFPTIFVVLLGPAVIRILETMM